MEEQNNRLLEVIQLRQRNLQKIKSKLGQAEDLLKCGSRDEYVYEELLKAVSLTEKFNLNIRDLKQYERGEKDPTQISFVYKMGYKDKLDIKAYRSPRKVRVDRKTGVKGITSSFDGNAPEITCFCDSPDARGNARWFDKERCGSLSFIEIFS